MPHTADKSTAGSQGKGRPTPKRKEAQARNARPLVGGTSKEAKAAIRREMAERRDRARIGMAEGDERYLPPRDKGEQRRFVRNYVDARTSVGEFALPVMFMIVVWVFLPIQQAVYGVFAMWALVLIIAIDSIIMSARLKKRLQAKFGADKVQKGYKWYATSRAMQMRPLRIPKPQVKRGAQV